MSTTNAPWLDPAVTDLLERLQRDIVSTTRRVRGIYVSKDALVGWDKGTTTIAVISPEEDLHLVQAGRDWVLNWYPARESPLALLGPPIDSFIPPIAKIEYVDELRKYLRDFNRGIDEEATPREQAYAILSICRGLYTLRYGPRPSKRQAAAWAEAEFPEWADLIHRAVDWRERPWAGSGNGSATVDETRAFVGEMTRFTA